MLRPGQAAGADERGDFASVLAPDDFAALRAMGAVRAFARGQALMHQEQVPRHVLLLRSGRVKVTSATVVAVEPVEALVVTQQEFRTFLAERPPAAMALLRLLARRLRDSDAKRIQFAACTTTSRVAARLLELCERFGSQEEDAILIVLPLSQEELAGWAGSSLEAVGRALRTMRSLGWIETARREIRVLDREALRRLAD